MLNEVYTANEAQDILGVSNGRVYQLARERNLGTRKGRTLLFSKEDIENLKIRVIGRPRKDWSINE